MALKPEVTLTLWVMPNAGFATRAIMEREIEEFRKSHPRTNVRLVIHPWSRAWDYLMDVAKDRPGARGPDLMQIGTTWVPTLAFLGMLSPLTSAQDGFEKSAFLPRSWDSCRVQGDENLYAVPWFLDVRVLYYRKDLLSRADIPEKLLEDWRGFSEACRRLLEARRRSGNGGPYPLSVSSQKPGVQLHDVAPWVWAAGGGFLDPVQNVSRLSAPETVRGLSFFYDLVADGVVPLMGRDTIAPIGSLFRGDYVMQFCGSWPAGSALKPGHADYRAPVARQLGVAPFPIGPKGRYTFMGGSNLAVSSRCQRSEEAWALVRFLSTRKSQVRHCLGVSAVPSRLDSLDEVFAPYPRIRSVFLSSLDFARPLHSAVAMGSIERALWHFGERVLKLIQDAGYDERSLRAEIQKTDSEINTILSFYGGSRSRA